jgi:ribonuclease-3
MAAPLGKLESLIGHRFGDLKLLERALTHRSWAHENLKGDKAEAHLAENESFEFLGDSILGLIIAEKLFSDGPDRTAGELTAMKHHLVSSVKLAEVAGRIRLGDYIRMGRGEEQNGGRTKPAILADALEAVIAAVFLDAGYTTARVFVRRLFSDDLKAVTPRSSIDPKTRLQELLQSQNIAAPTYTLLRSEGPPHKRTFHVEAVWANGRSSGEGASIKAAEMQAAEKALSELAPSGEPAI